MSIERILTTVDTHTAGGPTRTLTAGLPPLIGGSVAEKMEHFKERFDAIRKLLMCEPRGHRDMSGAVLTDPTHPDADVGTGMVNPCSWGTRRLSAKTVTEHSSCRVVSAPR